MNLKQTEIQEIYINKAVEFFKKNRRGYLDLAPRFGKVRTSYETLKRLGLEKVNTIICYPDNKIKEEWTNQAVTWKYSNSNVEYVNFSSLKKYVNSKPKVFIIDEFHATSPNERDLCHQIMTNDEDTLTICLSGSVSKETESEWGLPCIAQYTTEQGIEDGILAPYNITVHLVPLDTKVKTKNKKGRFLTEKQKYDNYGFVISKMVREGKNSLHLSLTRNRLALSSIGKKNYTLNLLKQLKDKRLIIFTGLADIADNLGIPSYHSKSENDQNYLDFKSGKINHLALAAMGKMGVDFPKLNSVILYNFNYNKEESKQILNRCMKLDYTDKIADLHVICLNEEPELKKVRESLSMLDKSKVKYI